MTQFVLTDRHGHYARRKPITHISGDTTFTFHKDINDAEVYQEWYADDAIKRGYAAHKYPARKTVELI